MLDILAHLRLQLAYLFQRPFGKQREIPLILREDLCPEVIHGSAQALDLFECLAELSFVPDRSLSHGHLSFKPPADPSRLPAAVHDCVDRHFIRRRRVKHRKGKNPAEHSVIVFVFDWVNSCRKAETLDVRPH